MATTEVGRQRKGTGAMPWAFSKRNIFSRTLPGGKAPHQEPKKPKVTKPVRSEPIEPKSTLKTTRKNLGELQCEKTQTQKAIKDVLRKLPPNVVDIDVHNDHFYNPAYAQDIIDYNHERERKFQLSRSYLCHNVAIMNNSRAILTDWLISVQDYYQMESETIHLAVALLDQFLARRKISLAKLQLLGITCLLIAAKFNERFPPTFERLLTLTENAYTEREVVKAELLVLKTLEYEVNLPIPNVFLDRYMKVVETDTNPTLAKKIRHAANYLLDLSLTDVKVVPVLPSVRAAGAVWLARSMLLPSHADGKDSAASSWPAGLAHYTGMSEASLQIMAQRYVHLLIRAENDKLQAARLKYSSKSRAGAISRDPAINNTEWLSRIAGMNVTSL